MPYTEGVVFAFAAFGEARQAASVAHGVHLLHAAGENFMRVGLVAHVPDDAVFRGIEYIVQGNGEFNDTQASTKVPARLAYAV